MQTIHHSYTTPPFPAFPAATRYVPVGSLAETMGRVCRSIDAHEAISLVIGPPGTGKSLLCNLLVSQYETTHEVVVLGDTEIENRAAFLRHLLHHLGADYNSSQDNDLHLALVDRVCGPDAPSGGLLIIVDEAQSLSTEILESIRMVTNIMRKGQPRVSAVVCGGMKLDDLLIDTSLEPFTQRVATRCYLHPLNGEETRRYIHETIRRCGAEPDQTIAPESIAAIHHACSGVPRLINQMMTQAIDCAEEADQAMITESLIDQAWAMLQQLPSPMVEEPSLKSTTGSPAIEFGELSPLDCMPLDCVPLDCAPLDCVSRDSEPAAMTMAATDEVEALTLGVDADLEIESECNTEPENIFEPDHETEPCLESSIDVQSESAIWMDEEADVAGQPDLAFDSDIRADVEAELTIEEHAQMSAEEVAPASTPLPSALFGEFECEEEIAVGNACQATAVNGPSGAEAETEAVDERAAACETNSLEASLHQEIIGLSTFDDTALVTADMTATNDMPRELTHPGDEACSDEMMSDEATGPHLLVLDSDDADSDRESDCETMSDEEEMASVDDMLLSSDDSDLLVIEDEFELTRKDNPANGQSPSRPITVDFQSMLNRMRMGT